MPPLALALLRGIVIRFFAYPTMSSKCNPRYPALVQHLQIPRGFHSSTSQALLCMTGRAELKSTQVPASAVNLLSPDYCYHYRTLSSHNSSFNGPPLVKQSKFTFTSRRPIHGSKLSRLPALLSQRSASPWSPLVPILVDSPPPHLTPSDDLRGRVKVTLSPK
ncbi:uncharacterized protein BDZ83DRAFT_196233 [Colletotrichum acutatum]|uniref:Uncharacterized protein n=1 Tax=Glomerella acutata TaxID=27357 RepID=A0AAD8XHM0_GLOAC|nr:uncharacterized protein BDZ83DRAFT_196233 [Colletotrichum acutatum]KAK1727587.1 hypothetical protein BDZ83DRAFT_196233 [Colletotrichum acutatum]